MAVASCKAKLASSDVMQGEGAANDNRKMGRINPQRPESGVKQVLETLSNLGCF